MENSAKKPKSIGHVIRVLDKFTLVIDVGKPKLSVGDIIQVYEIGDVINDLDGNALSYYVHIKDELEVVQVEELYSICRKPLTTQLPASLAVSPMLERSFRVRNPLNIDEKDVKPLKKGDSVIRIGDLIKLA